MNRIILIVLGIALFTGCSTANVKKNSESAGLPRAHSWSNDLSVRGMKK
jgi:PBP1b-binding outer membrane lipoprotein LpoB